MIFFKYGDRYATVATMQHVLNLAATKDPRLRTEKPLVEDGVFGRLTLARVKEVQRALDVHPASGILGPLTWNALRPIVKCRVVDVSDLGVESLLRREGEAKLRRDQIAYSLKRGKSRARALRDADRMIRVFRKERDYCRAQHNRAIQNGGMPIGVERSKHAYEVIRRGVAARSRDGWKVVLLRFTGHGSPAAQGVVGSIVGAKKITLDTLKYDDDDTAEELVETLMVSSIADSMPRWGCLELHGCSVGGRRRVGKPPNRILVSGPAYVQTFANTVGRPVTASGIGDSFGTTKLDARFDGAIVSKVPGGGTVKSFFKSCTT
ncbi:MAG: peptidoglycan-binding domain-containing protein [Planctomycetota bacterium]|jgi:hypothetical protein